MDRTLEITKLNMFVRIFILPIIVGILVGVLTKLGQGILPGHWNSLANLGSVWLVPSFFVASFSYSKRTAILSGILALLGMVLGYYGYAIIFKNVSHSIYFISVWITCAFIGGTIFGIAGFLWKDTTNPLHKLGSALIGGVFVTDGLHILLNFEDYNHMLPVGYTEVIVGIILILVLERSNANRISSFLMMVPITILGLIGYKLLSLFT
ncbi:DUF6518 family protein [Bacillus paranthracis]|uniref:DUF6518 family protein n=2 Tax=Bacillus cereus group TaxID=86661 RepID=A0A5M9H462_9BACI|nr:MULTISPECIES: DUF6518 family protein [Bacillus]ACJ78085.1 putative membrane protein [Bacillus cereus AH187]EEL00559.1 hypothetical protein bcere0013_23550 [Bacillus cereus BDRD-ST26]EJQ00193.1 hypothetical protein IAU_00439 [Bacillus cereus IS075]EJR17566.1 hypothetical protein II7_01750 [Bacillus cereus MSX-A12]EOO87934.1 hypothetical protein IGS_03821 [Bacillus cereus IS845/00]EOO96035.1 hypothetical protein IGQ_03578 [Bacillus cereus IS195]KFK73484.1 putative membrane protein [Bacillus